MTDDEWATFALLLDKGFKWREPFGLAQETTYRILLDGYDPPQIVTAIRSLVAAGQTFGPTPGEIVNAIRSDPGRPTFEEAYTLIYGPRGVLRARPAPGSDYDNEAAMLKARDSAALDRARDLHPLLFEFVRRYGVARLRHLEVDHEDYGELKRKDLRDAWDRHCEAFNDRQVAAIAERTTGGGLKQLDPMSSLTRPPALIEGR